MKRIININLSKDTTAETLKALYANAQNAKQSKRKLPLYLLNEDIEKLNERYEGLFKKVKNSLNLSEAQIEKECEILSQKYDFEIEELSKLREVDYAIKLAEIKARSRIEKPWRRCWLWLLLFKPLTNRAQDIIEARAELNANIIHSEAEKAIDDDRKHKFDVYKKLSKRKLKRLMRVKLKAAIKQADSSDVNEVLNGSDNETAPAAETPETSDKPQAEPAAPVMSGLPPRRARQPVRKRDQKPTTSERAPGVLPGQMNIADVVPADKPAR